MTILTLKAMKLNTRGLTKTIVFILLLKKEKRQSSPQLEDQNETNDWKTTDKHEGELVMAYNNNARSNTLYPRTFYV